MSDQEYDESALLEESGGENEIETETNETAGDEENDPVSELLRFWNCSLFYMTTVKEPFFYLIVVPKEPLDQKRCHSSEKKDPKMPPGP